MSGLTWTNLCMCFGNHKGPRDETSASFKGFGKKMLPNVLLWAMGSSLGTSAVDEAPYRPCVDHSPKNPFNDTGAFVSALFGGRPLQGIVRECRALRYGKKITSNFTPASKLQRKNF